MSDRDASPQPQAAEAAERRRIQRFLGQRRGQPYLWVTIGSERVALRDISVDGFAIAAAAPPAGGEPFDFVLQREGVPDQICGRAQAVNFIAATGQAGCRFLVLEGDADQGVAGLDDVMAGPRHPRRRSHLGGRRRGTRAAALRHRDGRLGGTGGQHQDDGKAAETGTGQHHA